MSDAPVREPAGDTRRDPRPWPVAVRRVRPDDREAILRFASTTWGGWDYIPNAFDDWVTAADGVFLAVTAVGREGATPLDADGRLLRADEPIAITRVTMLSAAEAWLEGIRVDPRVRGMGVATDLQVAELAWASAHGARILRYETSEENVGSHRLGARHGIHVHSAWRSYGRDDEAELTPEETAAVSAAGRERNARLMDRAQEGGLAAPRDASAEVVTALWARISADATLRAGGGLYEYRPWAMQELTGERLAAHVAAGEVLAYEDPERGWSAAILTHRGVTAEDLGLHLSAVTGDADALVKLVEGVERLSGERVRTRLPDPPPALVRDHAAELAAAGLTPFTWTVHVLERALDAAHPIPAVDPDRLILLEPPRSIARPTPPGATARAVRSTATD